MGMSYSLEPMINEDLANFFEPIIEALMDSGKSCDDILDILYATGETFGLDTDVMAEVFSESKAGQKLNEAYYAEVIKNYDDIEKKYSAYEQNSAELTQDSEDFEESFDKYVQDACLFNQESDTLEQDYDKAEENSFRYKKTVAVEDKRTERSSISCLGLYMRDVNKYKLLSREEEIKYAKMVHGPNKKLAKIGRDALINHNLRLVISIAVKRRKPGMELSDIISEGNLGLMKAVETYNYTRSKFSTYATHRIRGAITQAFNEKGFSVRIPANWIDEYKKLSKYNDQFKTANKRYPSVEEQALFLARYKYKKKHGKDSEPPEDKLAKDVKREIENIREQYLIPIWQTGELDRIISPSNDSDNNERTVASITPDVSSPDPLAKTLEEEKDREICEKIRILLDSLTPLESKVIQLAHGINCERLKTEEIAIRCNISKKEASAIISSAMRKLRGTARKKLASGLF